MQNEQNLFKTKTTTEKFPFILRYGVNRIIDNIYRQSFGKATPERVSMKRFQKKPIKDGFKRMPNASKC